MPYHTCTPGMSSMERKACIAACGKMQTRMCEFASVRMCIIQGGQRCQHAGRSTRRGIDCGSVDQQTDRASGWRRSLAAPAVMIMNASQGVFLAQQDTITPLSIFLAAATINALVCAALVLGLRLGLLGAALATCIVQVWCTHRQSHSPPLPGRAAAMPLPCTSATTQLAHDDSPPC
jgi:hypothetical protein